MTMPPTAFTQPVAVPPIVVAKKKSRKGLYLIIGGVVLLLLLVMAAMAKGRQQERPISVTFEKAVVKTITHLVTATGKVQPEIEVKISPEVAGEIIALPTKEGGLVKKGDMIVSIKPDFYKAQVDQQEAALVGAKAVSVQNKAQLIKAQEDLKRSDDLYAKKIISDSDYTVAKTALDVAQANYDNALAQIRSTEGFLSQSRDLLSKTTMYAPMDGTISALESEVGERVVGTGQFAGTEIMRIADLTNMEVRVKVNENDIVNVKLGDHTVVTVDAMPGRKFDGTVREISSSALTTGATGSGSASLAASASDEVTNFLVKIRISDREGALRPGMSATVDIETETVANVVAIPVQSVTVRAEGGKTTEQIQEQKAKDAKERSGNDLEVASERQDARRNRDQLHRVVFVHQGDKVAMVPVETGIADNTSIEVKTGIKAGDEVVSGSYAAISRQLKDGSKVLAEKPKVDEKK
jgi:HlyD family secretion protein